jgi:hypothetical protein
MLKIIIKIIKMIKIIVKWKIIQIQMMNFYLKNKVNCNLIIHQLFKMKLKTIIKFQIINWLF